MDEERTVVHCRPCKTNMEPFIKEAMGDGYWCPSCGAVVEISYTGQPAITVDKCLFKHSPINRFHNDH